LPKIPSANATCRFLHPTLLLNRPGNRPRNQLYARFARNKTMHFHLARPVVAVNLSRHLVVELNYPPFLERTKHSRSTPQPQSFVFFRHERLRRIFPITYTPQEPAKVLSRQRPGHNFRASLHPAIAAPSVVLNNYRPFRQIALITLAGNIRAHTRREKSHKRQPLLGRSIANVVLPAC